MLALVTGGTRGIGWACAQALARNGYGVVVVGRDAALLERAAQTLPSLTAQSCKAVACDLRSDTEVQALCKEVEGLGPVSVIVNAAGILVDGLCVRTPMSSVQEVLDVNLLGAMRVCKAFAPQMMRQRSGAIVNISSVMGIKGSAGQSAYSASKAGLIVYFPEAGFTKALAKELAPRQIRVNAVAPGYVDTDMIHYLQDQREKLNTQVPLGRWGTVEASRQAQVRSTHW